MFMYTFVLYMILPRFAFHLKFLSFKGFSIFEARVAKRIANLFATLICNFF